MYYGKMTKELEKLYDEYFKLFGVEPDFYINLEYGQADYKVYLNDIKEAIKLNKEIADFERFKPKEGDF